MDDIERMERENDRMKKEVRGHRQKIMMLETLLKNWELSYKRWTESKEIEDMKKKIMTQKRLIDAWAKSYVNAADNNWRLAYAVKEALEMIERKKDWIVNSAVDDIVYERIVGTMKQALARWDGKSVEHAIKILNRYYFDQIGIETIGKRPGAVTRSPRKPIAKKRKEVTVMKIEKCCGGKKKGCRGGKGK